MSGSRSSGIDGRASAVVARMRATLTGDVQHAQWLFRLLAALTVAALLLGEQGESDFSVTMAVPVLAGVYALLSAIATWPRPGVPARARARRTVVVATLDVAAVVAVALAVSEPRAGGLAMLGAVLLGTGLTLRPRQVVALSMLALAGCVAVWVVGLVVDGAGVPGRALELLLLGIAWAGLVARFIAVERRRRAERIDVLSASVHDLLLQAIDAGRQERARVADLLHDDVLQLLLVTGHDVADAIDGDLEQLPAARTGLAAATRRLRDTIDALRDEGRQDELLGEALLDLAGDPRPDRPAAVDVDVARGVQQIEHPVLVAVARDVVRDATTTGPGSRVAVTAGPSEDEPGVVVLVVRHDDRRAAAGLGPQEDELGDVARRVLALGGSLAIERTPQDERVVTVRVPVHDPTADAAEALASP